MAQTMPSTRRIPLYRKFAYSALACLLFFVVVECLLWGLGVETLIARRDPSAGFSGLVSVYVQEDDRYRTRASLRLRTFNDQAFPVDKAAGETRIFVLGGSSANGFPWNADAAFSGVLHDVLAEVYPDRHFEVINAAGISYAMHRLNLVAEEIVGYDPDVLVIYSGHNEFVERSFYEALKNRGATQNRLEHALAHTRIYSALARTLTEARGTGSKGKDQFGMTVRREQNLKFTEQEKQAIVDDFRDTLQQLVRRAQDRNVRVILATVPCNLRDWAPESVASLRGDEAERSTWVAAFNDGQRKVDGGQFQEAITALEQAATIAPQHAETHYLLGKAFEGTETWQRARVAYERACDCDASPDRRLSAVNDAIREVARNEGVRLLDVDRIFQDQSDHGLVGFNLIEDYVHPNKTGHHLIAWHLWQSLVDSGWLGADAVADRERFDRIVATRSSSSEGNAGWYFNQGVILQEQGHVDRAIEKYRQAVQTAPAYPEALQNLAQLLIRQGRYEEAARDVGQLLRVAPDFFGGHMLKGDLLFQTGRLEKAIQAYRQAVDASYETSVGPLNRLGVALTKKGDHAQALKVLNRGLGLDPENPALLLNLGNVHYSQKNWDKAAAQFQVVLRVNPNETMALFNLGMVYSHKTEWRQAERWFERALQVKPDFPAARQSLDQLQDFLRNQ